jgi:2,4-dienoyl-CoA reductase-like NADH-dependent reductase (Old Yellow Enzyme family)
MRAQSHDHVPTTLQAEYYAQRASAGLIIAEATAISPEGFGWADTPGLWTEEQVRGWRRVTDAIHAAGGRPAAWIAADIVRFEDGLLAEHWDVLQDEATQEESVSGLPMFGDRFPS